MPSPPLTAERAAHGSERDRGPDGIARLSSLSRRLAELTQIDGLSETTFHRWPVGPVHVNASHVVERASLKSEMLALEWRDRPVTGDVEERIARLCADPALPLIAAAIDSQNDSVHSSTSRLVTTLVALHAARGEQRDEHLRKMRELVKNQAVMETLKSATDPADIPRVWEDDVRKFKDVREKYLLYR